MMDHFGTTLGALLKTLGQTDASLPAVFTADGEEIEGGYHVTELRSAEIDSVDCGGRRDGWREAQLQLLDGRGGTHMATGKLAAILQRCAAMMPGLAELPLWVEYAPGNQGLGRYRLEVPSVKGGRLMLPLSGSQAICKPAAEQTCCSVKAACCG